MVQVFILFIMFCMKTEHSDTLTMVSRRALMSQVGCAAGCLRCRKANSRGQSVQVRATAAMSTSHLHIWQVTSSSIGDNEDVYNTLSPEGADSCTCCVDNSCSGCLIPAQLTRRCMGQTKNGTTGRSQVGCNAAEPQQDRLCSKLQQKSAGMMLHVLLLTASLGSKHSACQLQPGACWMCLNLKPVWQARSQHPKMCSNHYAM